MQRTLSIVAILMFWHALAAASTGEKWIQVQGGAWVVHKDDIAQIAKQIQDAAAKSRGGKKTAKAVSTYVIQFKGIVSAGKRVIELRGSCEADGLSRATLQKGFRNVLDGGECYFGALWDATDKKFNIFQFNGVA